MVFPSTWSLAISLLIFSVLCLGLWPLTYRAAGTQYRFEIFSIDFGIGALLLSVVAAYTLGTMGSDLDFSDSMMVSGRKTQLVAVAAGALFALGNMTLLAAISLIGLSRAVLLSSSIAAAISVALTVTRSNFAFPAAGIFLLLMSLFLTILAASAVGDPKAKTVTANVGGGTATKGVRTGRQAEYQNLKRSVGAVRLSNGQKGMIVGILSGVALGSFLPLLRVAQSEEFGIGPYGGILMACVGLLAATPLLNLFFMNLAIKGPSLGLSAYLKGKVVQRTLGVIGGALWAAGALAFYVVIAAPKSTAVSEVFILAAPFAAVVLTMVCGLFGTESAGLSAASRKLVYGASLLFACGAALFLFARAHYS